MGAGVCICDGRVYLFCITDFFEDLGDFGKDCRIIDRCRGVIAFTIGDGTHGLAQDLARSGLGQAFDHSCFLECGHRANLIADHGNDFGQNRVVRAGDPGLQHDKAQRQLPLKIIMHTNDRTFRNIGMA